MGILVVSDSLVQFFFAWEGVGITSFLLINFWYTRYEANRSAMKAVFINRFGDFGLYVGLLMFIIYFKTHSFTAINSLSYIIKNEDFMFVLLGQKLDLITFLSLFIFLGIVGKSAQLGLHT
jgi:NADH:ubiquinone oxidoreductase subunit 5 (subunit L)/multisubunit Na+/H+ antiporter MnhA subunit